MTVRCPRCDTLYRRPAEGLAEETSFRCASCRHVFTVPPDEREPAADAEETTAAADDEERFRFDDERDDAEDVVIQEPPPPPRPPRPVAAPPPVRSSSTARFALRACLFVTLVYGALSLWVYTAPDGALRALRRIPVIGGQLAEARFDPATVELVGLRGEYNRVRGDQLVFVISGTAVNRAAVAVQGIQVQGFVSGAETRRLTVFCGAAPREVHDLSLREIALLQTIEPPRDWSLAPGEQAPWRVVFPSPPTDLREFGAEVVAMRAPKRRPPGGPSSPL